jgi:chromosome segregation ATPase
MTNPVTHAFFVGRATAEALTEKLADSLTDLLSVIAKFDAQQRQNLREFVETVLAKAQQQSGTPQTTEDIQELIDNLRAEIAQLKAELQKYRNQSN